MHYYVERENERVVALYANPQPGRTEPDPLPDTDPEVAALLDPKAHFPALSRAQLLLGLLDNSITEADVFAVIDQIEDADEREKARINFKDRSLFERDFPLIAQLSIALSLTSQQIDTMWRDASSL